jgi:chromosome partitioning protein
MTDVQNYGKSPSSSARVVAVANQKGGSGKTTSAVHLATAVAEIGHRTLLVDLDPQGHASEALGVSAESLPTELSDVLAGEKRITDIIIPNIRPGLDLAPSNIRLSDMELTLVNIRFRETKLRRALEPVIPHYEYLFLDCPPNLGLLTVNALIAADYVLIPAASDYLSMLGVSLLLKTIDTIRTEANRTLAILGVLHTRYKPRTLHAREVIARTKAELGNTVRVYGTPIHESTRFAEATGLGKTVFEVAPDIQGAGAYRELAKEIVDATY